MSTGPRLSVEGLYAPEGPYSYLRGWNPIALIAFLVPVLVNFPGFLHSAGPKTFAFIGPVWTGVYTFAWFIGIGLAFGLYAGLTLALQARRAAPSPAAA